MSQKFFRKFSVDLRETFAEAAVFISSDFTRPQSFARVANRKDQMLSGIKESIQTLIAGIPEASPIGEQDSVEIRSDYFDTLWRERWLSPMALLTTDGFQNILELGDQTRTQIFTFHPRKMISPIQSDHCFGVLERVNFKGDIVQSPQAEELAALLSKLKLQDINQLAICFLHSDKNPSNEKTVSSYFTENGFSVKTSHQVCNDERGEWKRATETLKSLAQDYVWQSVKSEIAGLGFALDKITEKSDQSQSQILILEDGFIFPKTGHRLPFSPFSQLIVDHIGAPQIKYQSVGSEPGPVCFGKGVDLTIFDLLALKYELTFDDVKKVKVDHVRVKKYLTLLAQQMRTDWESAMNNFLNLSRKLFESEVATTGIHSWDASGWLAPYFLGRIKK